MLALVKRYNFVLSLVFCAFVIGAVSKVKAQSDGTGRADQNVTGQSVNTVESRLARKNRFIKYKANKNIITLVTGGVSETQVSFAQDFSDVLDSPDSKKSQGIRVVPFLGKGGVQNALDLLHVRGVDLAILQADALSHLRGQDPLFYKDIYRKIHYISSLYHAEWHVVAKKNIKNLGQLRGKKVNISLPLSGTYVTSRKVLELLGIRAKYTTYSDRVALERLKKGAIDAIIVLGGSPVRLLTSIKKEDGLHFVPADFYSRSIRQIPFVGLLRQLYVPVRLKHEDYPNLIEKGKTIPTIGNGVILAAYNWDRKSTRYKKISRFAKRFIDNFDKFREAGRHKKWHEVNMMSTPFEWRRFGYVEKMVSDHMKENKKKRTALSKDDKLFKGFVNFVQKKDGGRGNELSKTQQILLFREFKEFIGKDQ